MEFSPAWYLRNRHVQTLWGKLARRLPPAPTRVERWETPDGDFIDLHRIQGSPGSPRLVMLHGLEGTIRSHYAQGLLHEAGRRGWGADLLIFRSCGGEMNRARRFYHSGETTDIALVIDRLVADEPRRDIVAAGVSLGGNVLLKYMGERGDAVPAQLKAAVAVSVPFDLGRSSLQIQKGFARIYQWHFMRSLRRKAAMKLAQFPDIAPQDALMRARTMYDFDDTITAPLHGFMDAADYYRKSSSLGWLHGIRRPTLLLSSTDDPFLPLEVFNDVRAIAARNAWLTLEFSSRGGHAGFIAGDGGRLKYFAEKRACDFLALHVDSQTREKIA
ncbi:MAG TPA: hydrolase [Gemmatimonadaceae bacterium]|nr:hydrolase [Gemmatimonadaceae bacterium]